MTLGNDYGERILLQKGVRQDDSISPVGFTMYLEYVLGVFSGVGGESIHGHVQVNNLKFDILTWFRIHGNDVQC